VTITVRFELEIFGLVILEFESISSSWNWVNNYTETASIAEPPQNRPHAQNP